MPLLPLLWDDQISHCSNMLACFFSNEHWSECAIMFLFTFVTMHLLGT